MDSWTPEKRAEFLELLADSGSIKGSCESAGLPRSTFYKLIGDDPAFAAQVEAARAQGGDVLEAEAFRRALSGSDVLLIFMLKGAKPERYREKFDHQHSGPGGKPIETVTRVELVGLTSGNGSDPAPA